MPPKQGKAGEGCMGRSPVPTEPVFRETVTGFFTANPFAG